MGANADAKNYEDKHFFTLDRHEINGAAKNRTLFFLIIGDKYNASYLIYKQALQKLMSTFFAKKSFMYAACFSPLDMRAYQKEFDIPRYPVLKVFFKGEIVAELTELPDKFQADDFIIQLGLQALLINLERRLGAQMYRILKLKDYKKSKFRVLL